MKRYFRTHHLTVYSLKGILMKVLYAALLLSLYGCSFGPETQNLNVQYRACTNLNPDINGEASPVVVTLYQLKSVDELKESDFFSLDDNPKNILKDALLTKSEVEIRPNQILDLTQELLPETKYMAFTAAYRDINNAAWKISVPLTEIKKKQITVLLESEAIKVGSGEKK